jgi:hypothetical protein
VITGIAVEIIHPDVEETYAFLRDKLGIPGFDAGGGFMVFEPAKVILEAGQSGDVPFTLSFQCDDIESTVVELQGRDVACKPIREEPWGRTSEFSLPNGRSVMLYQSKMQG